MKFNNNHYLRESRKIDIIHHSKDFDISYGALDLILGNRLGSGFYRDVYECKLNPLWVVKIQHNYNHLEYPLDTFHNMTEWILWNSIIDDIKLRKFFAPCQRISNNGQILIQSKTTEVLEENVLQYKYEYPSFLKDIKRDNFGLIDGELVMHDYGYLKNFFKDAYTNFKMLNYSNIK